MMKKILIYIALFVTGVLLGVLLNRIELKKEKTYTRYIEKGRNGQKEIDAFYDETGKRYGIQRTYFENGNLQSIVSYENDTTDGVFIVFYENEELRYITNCRKDKLDGNFVTFEPNYKKIKMKKYHKGRLIQ